MNHTVPDADTEFDHKVALLREVLGTARGVSAAVAWWSGEGDPEIEVTGARDRPLTLPEYKDLQGRRHSRGHERVGLLRTGGARRQVVAWTRAVVLPDRLPPWVRTRLGIEHPDNPGPVSPTGEPIGVVLGELGTRATRTTTVRSILGHHDAVGEPLVLACTGIWVVDGLPAVVAVEEVLRGLVDDFTPPQRH
jgi:hypothetical protein